MSSGSTPRHARPPETCVFLCNLMMKLAQLAFRAAPLSLGRIVPIVAIGRVIPFIPRERPTVIKHTIAGYLWLLWPTSAPALMRELH